MPSRRSSAWNVFEKLRTIPDRPRRDASVRGRTPPGCPAASPTFHSTGMHAEGAVGDVRDAEVLPARQQVLDAHRDHRAERDLERPAAEVEVAGAADAGMEIDPVAADPHRVGEQLGAVGPQRMRDVLLEHGELGAQPPRLPHVRRGREPVRRAADDVAAEAQPGVADAAVGARRLGLQPVEQAEAELPRRLEIARALGRRRRRRRDRTSSRSAASSRR